MLYDEQSAAQLLKVRSIFYDLLVNVVEANVIIKMVLDEIVSSGKIRDEILMGIIEKASSTEQSLSQGSKAILHLECFAAHVMEAVMEAKRVN